MTTEPQNTKGLSESALKRKRVSISRTVRNTLIIAACALLATAGYYAWRTWFAGGSSQNNDKIIYKIPPNLLYES